MFDNIYITNEDAVKVLETKLITDFVIKSIKFKPLSDEPSGFNTEHLILTITVERNNSKEIHSFFCKVLPRSDHPSSHTSYMSEIGAFAKEANLFRHLLPVLQNISSDTWAPRSYFAKENIIIMDDLSKDGYRLCTKFSKTIFDYEHVLLAAVTVAKFHAASLVYEKNHCSNGETIHDLFTDMLFENTYPSDPAHIRKLWMANGIEALLSLVRLIPGLNEQSNMAKINIKFPEIFRNMSEIVKPSKKYRNVVGHADLWSYNILFKYDEEERPVKCALVDYQFSRYAPPAMDLMPLIFMTTTMKDREEFLPRVLDGYYTALNSELRMNNLDVNMILPRSQFDSSCHDFECAAIVEGLLFGQTFLLPGDLGKEIVSGPDGYFGFVRDINKRKEILVRAFQNDRYYRERITEMLTCLIEKFIL